MRRRTLRVALLTLLELAAPGSTLPRAFLRVGGVSTARQQLGLVLALGCERIICIANGLAAELIEMQHVAERAGVQFNVISGPRALVGLVTAVDEIIVLGDGLFVSGAGVADLLEQGQAVLIQPIEQGLAAGFERIDINHTGAAAMRIPGRLVERLAELPVDCDAASALQRIALQAGVRQRPIPPLTNGGLFWTLIRSEGEAHALEPQWIRQRTQDDRPLGPARAVALVAVRNFGPALLHAGSGAGSLTVAAVILALLAAGAGWFKLEPLGLAFCALGWTLREAAVLLARIERDGGAQQRGLDSKAVFGWSADILIIALAGLASAEPWQPLPDRFFPAVMLIALLRILPQVLATRWHAWLEDRALLSFLLGSAIVAGFGNAAIHGGAILAALAGIALPGAAKRLTRA